MKTITFPAEKLELIAREWDKAEKYVKLSETISGKASAAAVAELRYAGRRIVDAINEFGQNGESDTFNSYIADAQLNCLRAQHDSIDSSFFILRESINHNEKCFGVTILSKYVADYNSLWDKIFEVDEQISLSREERDKRVDIYDKIASDLLPEMIKTHRAIKKWNAEMIKEKNDNLRRKFDNKMNKRLAWLMFIIMLVSLIVNLILGWLILTK